MTGHMTDAQRLEALRVAAGWPPTYTEFRTRSEESCRDARVASDVLGVPICAVFHWSEIAPRREYVVLAVGCEADERIRVYQSAKITYTAFPTFPPRHDWTRLGVIA